MPTHHNDHQNLLQRVARTRYPVRVPLGPHTCRTCHLQRTPQERRSDDLLAGQCRECHDPNF